MPSQIELLERELQKPLFAGPNARDWRYPPSRTRGLKKQRKLSWDEVNEIRRSYVRFSKDANKNALAERFGVSATTIDNILRGKKWRVTKGDGNVLPPLPTTTELGEMRALLKHLSEMEQIKKRVEALEVFDPDEVLEMFPASWRLPY